MQPTAHTMPDAAGAARERNRGAETITTLCGERPDSKGKAYGGGRRGARAEGAAIQISGGREGVKPDLSAAVCTNVHPQALASAGRRIACRHMDPSQQRHWRCRTTVDARHPPSTRV